MKKIMLLTVMICFLALAAMPAFATSVNLYLDPAYQEIPVGGTASVNLFATGQTDFGFGGFFIDISYDPSILSIGDSDVMFGINLGDPSLWAIGDTSVSGVVSLFEVADPSIYLDLSSTPILLATLNFTGIGVGISPLDFIYVDLADAYVASIDSADVTTTGAEISVPEPTTLLLLGVGLIGLVGIGRKNLLQSRYDIAGV